MHLTKQNAENKRKTLRTSADADAMLDVYSGRVSPQLDLVHLLQLPKSLFHAQHCGFEVQHVTSPRLRCYAGFLIELGSNDRRSVLSYGRTETFLATRSLLLYRGRIKYRQVENRQFFPPHVFNAPAQGVSLEIGYRRKGSKN